MNYSDDSEGLSRAGFAIFVTALLLGSIGLIIFLNEEVTEPLEVVWLDPADEGGYDKVMEMTEGDVMVFAAAKGVRSGKDTFTVRGFSGSSGDCLWSSHLDLGGDENSAYSVAVSGNMLAATGWGETVAGDRCILVAAYEAITGRMLWNDVVDLGGGYAMGTSVAVDDGMIFVAGQARTESGLDLFLVLAYDAKTGEIAWSDGYGNGGGENSALDIVATSDGIYAVGFVENYTGIKEFFVRAYSPETGSVLWNDTYDRGGWEAKACEVTTAAGSIFVAGLANDDAGQFRSIVRAYSETGSLMWEVEGKEDGSAPTDIAFSGGRLYTSGVKSGSFFVDARNAANGTMVWEEELSIYGSFNLFTALDAEDGRVTAVLFSQNVSDDAEYLWHMQVRQYESRTGKMIQSEDLSGEGSTSESVDILIHGRKVFATAGTGRLTQTSSSLSLMYSESEGSSDVTKVSTEGYKIKVNEDDFLVKGVNYSPEPIGSDKSNMPWGDWFQPYWKSIYERDIPLLKDMGANTLKTYAITAFRWDDPSQPLISHTDFYDKLAQNGMFVIPSVYTTKSDIQQYDPSNWDTQLVMQQWKAIIAEGKDHPAVLGWCLGNEVNGADVIDNQQFWSNYNDMLGHIKSMSPDKITLVALQDESEIGGGVAPIRKYEDTMTNLDVWGVNSYRGTISAGFDFIFDKHKTYSKKPLLIAEFGPPESARDENGTAVLQPDNGKDTADYIEVHWQGHHDSIMSNTDVCQGGFVFEWIDEWEKIPPVWQHDASTQTNPAFPGGWWDEEWFGINGVSLNGRDPMNVDPGKPDILSSRASFDLLKSIWNE